MSDLKRSVVSGLRWQAAAKLGSQLISWTVTIVVMRLLAPADYGLMAMAMVLVGLTSLVAEMGLGASLVQARSADLAQQRSVFGLSLMVNGGLYLLLAALAPLAVLVFKEPRLLALTLVMGLQLPLSALAVVPESMARRDLRFKALSLIELATQVTTVLATLACAKAGLGVWALVAGQLVQTVTKAVLLTVSIGGVLPDFRLRGQGRTLAFGGSLTTNRVIWYFSSQADVFIAGQLLGPQLLGTYSVAVNLANMPMQKIMSIANQVAFSAFAKLRDDADALAAGLVRSLQAITALSVGLLWGLAAAAPVLLPLLLGDSWGSAVIPLQVMAAMVPVRIAAAMLSTALIASGHVSDDLRNTLVGVAVLVPAFFAGAYLGGLHGLVFSSAVAYPVYWLTNIRRAGRRFQLSMRALLTPLVKPAACGAIMVAAMTATRWAIDAQHRVLTLAAMLAAGAIAYLLATALLDRQLIKDTRQLLAG